MRNGTYNERMLGLQLVMIIWLSSQDFYMKTPLKKGNGISALLLLVSYVSPGRDKLSMVLILASKSNQKQHLQKRQYLTSFSF